MNTNKQGKGSSWGEKLFKKNKGSKISVVIIKIWDIRSLIASLQRGAEIVR